jgi:hypothetical protein
MKIITYATHSEGTFDQLTSSGEVTVLGFGEKWNGFIGKAKSILKYLETQSDDELIIVIDGFDTTINKKIDSLEQVFINQNCKVLYSLDDKNGTSFFTPKFITDYIRFKIFGTCKDGVTANAGLYMGYCKYLKIVINEVIKGESDDDQRNINQACKKFPFLKIDTENIIFENCSNIEEVKNSQAFFTQIPAGMNTNRIIRMLQDYTKYFIPEIIFFILVVLYILF